MDVRAKQRLSYQRVFLIPSCVVAVSPHVISIVRCFLVKMNRQYYILWFRLDVQNSYLIWFGDEDDGVVTDAIGKVPCFLKTDDLLRYASSLNLPIKAEEPILHDLDFVASWLKTKNAETVDCDIFLAAWNLFDDVSRSVGGNFNADHKLTAKIYEKLFWGNNIPAVTPEGEHYEPTWTNQELMIMREILGVGLSLFRKNINCV